MKEKIKLWFSIIRPKTLLTSFMPTLWGVTGAWMLALPKYEFEPWRPVIDKLIWPTIAVLVCAVALQVLSNLINDYYDFKSGLDTKGRVGPKRALAEGLITKQQMKKAILIDAALCVILGVYLVYIGGWPILLIGVSAMFFAWLYTATPYSLSYLGIAEIFAFLYYGPIATGGAFYLLTHNTQFLLPMSCFGIICGLIATMVLTINNIRDTETDRQAGKKTLCARFGKRAGEIEYLICVILMAIPCLIPAIRGFVFVMVLPITAFILYLRIRKAQGSEYNKYLFYTSLLNILYPFSLLLG